LIKLDTPATEQALRQAFRRFNRFMLLQWRLGFGPVMNVWPGGFGRFVVVVHTGRRTGRVRHTPVNYALIDGDIYCTAGFGSASDWFRNLQANPDVELWLPEGRWRAHASDVSNAENRLALLREVLLGSGFAAPLMGVDPRTLPDEALDAATLSYRLVRFRRTAPVTGPGGPGDLAWVWPLAVLLLLPLALRRRKLRR
jgi:deazaflavin-dependent oxidoreductase (nitroreductase family)